MERLADLAQEITGTQAGEFNTLAGEVSAAMADFKSIFGSASEGAANAIKEQFGDLLLVDDSASAVTAIRGNSNPDRGPSQGRVLDNNNGSPTVNRSGNVQVDLDSDGQVRRGVVVDEDGLRARELQIPKGNTPLDEGPEREQAPQDRFVEIDNQRRPVEVFKHENIAAEFDEDGEVSRAIVVDEDGRRAREVTFEN